MRNVLLLLGIGQLLLLVSWGGSWLMERRQRPPPQVSPGRQRLRVVLAATSLVVAAYAFTRAWMLS
jgi:hypothetical protein